ncbi:hypothetical protein CAP36_12800 [Chitinophagaceae bacterium IBVUCB2]|nr:hypothetical protein CAP36_12800 [Chitinophagaceae bacterium IBVUCB2]
MPFYKIEDITNEREKNSCYMFFKRNGGNTRAAFFTRMYHYYIVNMKEIENILKVNAVIS